MIKDAEKARISAEKAYLGIPNTPDGSNKDGSGYKGHIGVAATVPIELDSNLKRHLDSQAAI
ncbi:hypothetical protein N7540_007172 [Penicillium herquei]|nr:hypothetical protein N7540_007172 [Penicillium herquei]